MTSHSFLKNFFKYTTGLVFVAVTLLFTAFPVNALEIKDAAVEIRNDFVLEPAKTEVVLKPGGKVNKTLSVVNRTDREQVFSVEIEDFTGSRNVNQTVVLLGGDRGPYSLKDFIKPEVKSFKLKPKQRAIVQVSISIPQDAEPGGRYASVLVSTSAVDSSEEGDSRARTISRIGALYFVRVEGRVKEDARLSDFRISGDKKSFYEKGPFNFELLFENNGSVHLTPSGRVEVKNIFGRKVAEMEVPPFFSLPDSLRAATVTWDSGFAFGRYTATATIVRGYQESSDVTDTKTVAIWVLPWKVGVAIIVAVLLVAWLIRKLLRSFEIKRKK